MKNVFFFSLFFLFAINTAISQIINPEIDRILNEVIQNNTTLLAHKQKMEARALQLKTGLNPSDPEFEAAYFYGSPSTIGNRTNLSFTQAFDFPSAYFHKNKIASGQISQLSIKVEKKRKDILFETLQTCLYLIYHNALSEIYLVRLNHASTLEESYKKMHETGEVSILEYNKTRINLLNLEQIAEKIEIEREALHAELIRLNGGDSVSITTDEFGRVQIPGDFQQWYQTAEQQHPGIRYMERLADIRQREEKLQRSLNLPSFRVGYVSEELTNEKFEGVMAGISIPVWENKNTMKYAKANTLATSEELADLKNNYYNTIRKEYQTATSLQTTLSAYKEIATETENTTDLLYKAWQEGEKGITEYLLDLSYYYEIIDKMLQTELELFKSTSKLFQYTNQYVE